MNPIIFRVKDSTYSITFVFKEVDEFAIAQIARLRTSHFKATCSERSVSEQVYYPNAEMGGQPERRNYDSYG